MQYMRKHRDGSVLKTKIIVIFYREKIEAIFGIKPGIAELNTRLR